MITVKGLFKVRIRGSQSERRIGQTAERGEAAAWVHSLWQTETRVVLYLRSW